MQLGKGKGEPFVIGWAEDRHILAYPDIIPDKYRMPGEQREALLERVAAIVQANAQFECENTNPGAIIFWKKPSKYVYNRVMTKILTVDDIKIDIFRMGDDAVYRVFKNGRGLIGATAAVAWEPQDLTYELIAYRKKEDWGGERGVDYDSVVRMDKEVASTFDNVDLKNKHVCIAPRSPCPILFGIRGENPKGLIKAKDIVKTAQAVDRWLIYQTNQGTDDHLEPVESIMNVQPNKCAIVKGEVSEEVKNLPGGHVICTIADDSGFIDCAAYEPTKEFREVLRELVPGDEIVAYGSVREEPITVNLEKVCIKKLAEVKKKKANPICKKCNKSMGSLGKGKGYRCKKCSEKAPEEAAEMVPVERKLAPGFYETPSCARRHLAKPLKRGKPKEI